MLTGILLANGSISASILSSLFNENLVKEGKDKRLVKSGFAAEIYGSETVRKLVRYQWQQQFGGFVLQHWHFLWFLCATASLGSLILIRVVKLI